MYGWERNTYHADAGGSPLGGPPLVARERLGVHQIALHSRRLRARRDERKQVRAGLATRRASE
eukprot:5500622-Pyramimonas_sp.AAC.2